MYTVYYRERKKHRPHLISYKRNRCFSFYPTTLAPNGIRDRRASLKNCLPNGIPTMVMHHSNPTIRLPSAISHPKKTIQIRLIKNENIPFPYTTSLPNGQNANVANLKHCIPTGIPTMVIHQIQPAKIHESPPSSPPKRNHRILPKNLIFFSFVCYRLKVIPNHCTVFHTPCSIFFICHVSKIGLYHSGDSVVGNQNIGLFIGLCFYFIKKIIDSLCQPKC